jgi:hypothetical protein
MKLHTGGFYSNLLYKLTTLTGTLHEDLHAFLHKEWGLSIQTPHPRGKTPVMTSRPSHTLPTQRSLTPDNSDVTATYESVFTN